MTWSKTPVVFSLPLSCCFGFFLDLSGVFSELSQIISELNKSEAEAFQIIPELFSKHLKSMLQKPLFVHIFDIDIKKIRWMED